MDPSFILSNRQLCIKSDNRLLYLKYEKSNDCKIINFRIGQNELLNGPLIIDNPNL
jgi:hypothetical protein